MSHASQSKSNPPVCLEAFPAGADNDKRQDKIRQKNERKHQRQKERRAQELRERCRSYLMSWKLHQLTQTLVCMGFSRERVIFALALNEGRIEESIAWLFENHECEYDKTMCRGGNLKIDISEELALIADMEIRYGCSKQEVERVIVSCEGDLEKTAEILRESKHDPPSAPPAKPEATSDPPIYLDKISENLSQDQVATFGVPSKINAYSDDTVGKAEHSGSENLSQDQEQVATFGVPSKINVYSDDAVGKEYGVEHSGRVRGLGVGICPTEVFGTREHFTQFVNVGSSIYKKIENLENHVHTLEEKLNGYEETKEQLKQTQNQLATLHGFLQSKFGDEFPILHQGDSSSSY